MGGPRKWGSRVKILQGTIREPAPFRSAAPIAFSIGTPILKAIGAAERNGAGSRDYPGPALGLGLA